MANDSTQDALQAVESVKKAREAIVGEVRKVIVGQQAVVDDVLACLFSRGHALLVGVPGLAKTLLVSTIAKVLDRARASPESRNSCATTQGPCPPRSSRPPRSVRRHARRSCIRLRVGSRLAFPHS